MRIGIAGFGWVGKAIYKLFDETSLVYDPVQSGTVINEYEHRITDDRELLNNCDVVFICVPTPCMDEGKLDISIVEDIVSWCEAPLLVIRSTVNPGDTSRLFIKYRKDIVVQPEYLGETTNHPLSDLKTRPFLVIGGSPENRKTLIDIYTQVYNADVDIRQVSSYEAEVIKLTENRAIAMKVAMCQELYDVCQKAEVDYYTIRQAVFGDDPRFNLWFTMVYPDKRGFNSKCMPKDVYAWCAWAESLDYDPEITRAILEKNKEWVRFNE